MADLPCPTCGSPLDFLEQYHRHYCHTCGQYAPEGYGERGALRCPTCGGVLSYVTQYDRFYCYRCNAYAPPEGAAPAKSEAPAETPAAAPTVSETTSPSTEIVATSAPSQVTLVAASPSTPAPATPEPTEESEAPPEREAPVAEPTSPPAAATAEPVPTPAEPAPAEPSKEMQALAASKPGVVRVKIFALKKAELIDLCKAYNLDPSGTKDQIQERLLSYLHDLEAEETEVEPEAEPSVSAARASTPAVAAEPAKEAPVESPPEARVSEPGSAVQAAAILIEEPKPAPAAHASTAAAPVVVAPAAEPVETSRYATKAEHPCPTCGRELTYVAQYGRFYCYYCQRYAPALRSKNACPACGATMRWVDQYQRWWCDSCQRYASADLPKPTAAAATRTEPVAAAEAVRPVARPAVAVHRHASPGFGIGLAGLGLTLWIIYEFFATLAPALGVVIDNPFTPPTGALMTFFSFVFVAAGVMVGLSSLRDRP